MFLQSLSTAAMEKAMSATWQRTQLIMTNIANEDTPGFKAKRLDFESALRREIKSLRDGENRGVSRADALARLDGVAPTVYEDESTIVRADGNNVDINAEQIELVRAQYQYQALSQKISGYYTTLQYAISGGR